MSEYAYCKCGKRCYSKRDAMTAINYARSRHVKRKKYIPLRVYYCSECGTYHLTSERFKTSQYKKNMKEFE